MVEEKGECGGGNGGGGGIVSGGSCGVVDVGGQKIILVEVVVEAGGTGRGSG